MITSVQNQAVQSITKPAQAPVAAAVKPVASYFSSLTIAMKNLARSITQATQSVFQAITHSRFCSATKDAVRVSTKFISAHPLAMTLTTAGVIAAVAAARFAYIRNLRT